MKVLAIMGSPRRGDSYKVTLAIEKKMKELGDVEFEYMFLKDMNLKQCIGCHACIIKGEDKCPLMDDTDLIEKKMMESDGIILVSPVYSLHVTALMKNFMDHFAYVWHRPRFFGKKAMGIATGGGQFSETLGYLKQVSKAWGFDFVTKIGVPHLESLTPKYRDKTLKEIDQAAENFYKSILGNRFPVPSIGDIMWFNIWKGNSEACKDALPMDYPYWKEKGWIDKEYFYDTRIIIFKKIIVGIISKIGAWYMHKVFVGY